MNIEIKYNGSHVVCEVDGKHFEECDSLTKALALNAFRTIEKNFYGDDKIKDMITKAESV